MKVVCISFFPVDKSKAFSFPNDFSLFSFEIYSLYLLYISILVGQVQIFEYPNANL